jgi:hypothetical protein
MFDLKWFVGLAHIGLRLLTLIWLRSILLSFIRLQRSFVLCRLRHEIERTTKTQKPTSKINP